MRIGDYKNKDLKAPVRGPLKNQSVDSRGDFSKTLDSHQERERIFNMKQLLERIEDTGKIVANSRNLADLKRYKNAVADFLEEANSMTYRLKEENSWDFMGNRKHTLLVEKIDTKMEELTEEVKTNEEKNLKILELLGEIKGLLIDSYM